MRDALIAMALGLGLACSCDSGSGDAPSCRSHEHEYVYVDREGNPPSEEHAIELLAKAWAFYDSGNGWRHCTARHACSVTFEFAGFHPRCHICEGARDDLARAFDLIEEHVHGR